MSSRSEEKRSKNIPMYSTLVKETPTFSSERDTSLFNILRGFEEFVLNKDGIIISSNLEAVNVTGYEEWEVIGNSLSIFYPTEAIQENRVEADLAMAAQKGQFIVHDWRLKKRNTKFWAKMKITALLSSTQQLIGYKVVLKDTTHKALYNHRVKRIKDEYLNLFNNAYTGIFKFRIKDFQLLLLNEKATEIIGQEEYSELSFRELFMSSEVFDDFSNCLQQEKRVEGFEFQINKPGRVERWASVSCRYFHEHGFVEGILIDVTDSKKQLLELQRLNHELDQFIYHASHDLRSPLTTILGLVNLIKLDEPTPLIAKYSELIDERVHHLDGLLKDLVSITYNNKTHLQPETINLDDEVRTILREFHHQYNHVQAFLTIEGSHEFATDPIRFRTIVRNLISNALKYHNPHVSTPFLKIHVHNKTDQAIISVEDNGIGIEDAYLMQIFGMFFRATERSKGTGLGLYIVKSMVDKLGGHIHVTSKHEMGTTFSVELPCLLFSDN